MEHLAPLLQTVLWVSLVAGIVWRFNRPLHALLVSLQKRVESASTIKAGPFEISQQLRPQDPTSQREKVEVEIRELQQTAPNSSPDTRPKSTKSLQNRYFQAEDLALRAIQAEYGVSISRQVTAGSDRGFDGAFVLGGRLHVVEVKYSFHKITPQVVRISIERLISYFEKYGWGNVQIILALVYEDPSDINLEEDIGVQLSSIYSTPIEIRKYLLADLEQEFGVSDKEAG